MTWRRAYREILRANASINTIKLTRRAVFARDESLKEVIGIVTALSDLE
jgi:hypothetical protein